jgi:hypothetical protein
MTSDACATLRCTSVPEDSPKSADRMSVVSHAAKTLDVAHESPLDHRLPGWTNDDLAPEPLVVGWFAAEQTSQHVVNEDLRHQVGR